MRGRPYSKRVVRARVREARLRELGYDTYSAYLASPAWRDLKRRYRASGRPQICMCGETKFQLHHTTYDRVAHDLEAAGIIELDLKGFYYDPERARDGKMYLAQLAAVCPDGEVLRADKRRVFEEWRAKEKADRGRSMRAKVEKKRQPPSVRLGAAKAEHMDVRTFDSDPVEYEYTPGAYDDLATEQPDRWTPHEPRLDWRPSAIPMS